MFWKNEEWLKKCEIESPELYEAIKNGREFKMEWNPLALIIDDIAYELTITDDSGEIPVIFYKD